MARTLIPLLFVSVFGASAWAQTALTIEGAAIWQSQNDQRVPSDTGTDFSIADFDTGAFYGYRIYVGHKWSNRHEVRALYAPFAIEVNGRFEQPVTFQDGTFAANTDTTAYYKFNSYRLTYAYHFDDWAGWKLALGFTGKIRDAEVRLEQGGVKESKSNVGFVPLLNFQARYDFSNAWAFRFDVDGLAAPQGRAIDAGLFLERNLESLFIFTGYRTIEGGADNEEVYNFAWIHQAVLGARYEF